MGQNNPASQVIRFFRICNSFNGFKKPFEIIVNAFIKLGFGRKLLLNRYKYIGNKHGISNKFKLAGELQCIFTEFKIVVMVNLINNKGAVFYII